jgi:lipoyl(octanoyl) transferase
MNVFFEDLGNIGYEEAWEYQRTCHEKLARAKTENLHSDDLNRFLFCEHPHVYTLGKSGQESNLLINSDFLKSIDATFFKTDRGGDITYHGPGQIVGYPIMNLEQLKMGIKSYIHNLEECIIQSLKAYSITAERMEHATGVWLDTAIKEKSRKICAIGVRVSRSVTMHGFALNVNTDLRYFDYIHPCGLADKDVTSMQKELGKKIEMEDVKKTVRKHFCRLFKVPEP